MSPTHLHFFTLYNSVKHILKKPHINQDPLAIGHCRFPIWREAADMRVRLFIRTRAALSRTIIIDQKLADCVPSV